MTDLKSCFFCISDMNAPYLSELMAELNAAGVNLYIIDPCMPFPVKETPQGSYTVTDNKTGINFARLHDTGYIAYSAGKVRTPFDSAPDAQCVIEGFDEVTADFIEKMYQRKNDIPWLILETERTLVKELSINDIDNLFSLYDDEEIKRFIPPLSATKEEELEFQKAYIEKIYGFFGYGFWNILDKESGELIGRAGISNRKGFDTPELGYLLAAPYRNKGIAYEVCGAVMRYAHDILGMEELNAFIQNENLPSIRLSEKLGFTDTGEEITGVTGQSLKRFSCSSLIL